MKDSVSLNFFSMQENQIHRIYWVLNWKDIYIQLASYFQSFKFWRCTVIKHYSKWIHKAKAVQHSNLKAIMRGMMTSQAQAEPRMKSMPLVSNYECVPLLCVEQNKVEHFTIFLMLWNI